VITIDGRNIRLLRRGKGEIVTLLISETERSDLPIRLTISDANALIAMLRKGLEPGEGTL
jgi:hypothetical protein